MSEWLGILWVFALFIGLMVSVSLLKKHISAEFSRKLIHIGMGLVALTFPWLFHSPLPVIAIGSLCTLLLLGIKYVPVMREKLGKVLGEVDRSSWGELYFPVAVVTLFILSKGDFILYGIPILILSLADATSALIGVQYGQSKYQTTRGTKSVEGSLAFFTVTFLSTHLPLLLLTTTGRIESVLIAAIIGILVMILEAVGSVGLDNLFIPLGAYVFLKIYLPFTSDELLSRFIVLGALLLGFLACRKWIDLKASALLLSILILYVFWALGGWVWLTPAVITLLFYVLFISRYQPEIISGDTLFGSRTVISTASASLLWLFLQKTVSNWITLSPNIFLFAGVIAFACHIAIMSFSTELSNSEHKPSLIAFLQSVVISILLLVMPYIVYQFNIIHLSMAEILSQSLIAIGSISSCTVLFYVTQKDLSSHQHDILRWVRRGILVVFCSAMALLF